MLTLLSNQRRSGRAPRREAGRTIAVAAGALALLAAAAATWWATRQNEPARDGPGERPAGVPVVIYLIDTLRADRLQTYGYARPTSPHIDELARESVVFEQAYSAAPWTLPSVASLITSTYMCEHGVVAPELKLDPSIRTLAERMKALGYVTGAYYSNLLAGPPAALDRGYDFSVLEDRTDVRVDEAGDYFDRIGDALPFLYLHTMEPHQPYLADYRYIQPFGHVSIDQKMQIDEYWQSFVQLKRVGPTKMQPQAKEDATARIDHILTSLDRMRAQYELLYDASVLQADQNLGDVIELLKKRGIWDEALFIVLADHGEEFGEHGIWFHEESMYEAVTRVPLIIRFPRGQYAGLRIAEPVSLVDVAPTILDYIGQPELCDGCRGMSLMGLVRGEPGRGDGPFVTGLRINATTYHRPFSEKRGDTNVAMREAGLKGIWNEEPQTFELYDLAKDPAEREPLPPATSEATRLRADAVEWLRDCRSALKTPVETPLDEQTRERLKSLGYIR